MSSTFVLIKQKVNLEFLKLICFRNRLESRNMGQIFVVFSNLAQICRCSPDQQEYIRIKTANDSEATDSEDEDLSQIVVSTTFPGNTNSIEDFKFSDRQVEDLAEIVVSKHMATIAIKYFELPQETVENLRSIRQGDYIGFNRDVLVLWRNKNQGINQVQVSEITGE